MDINHEFAVCYASSDEYAQFTGVSLLSLLHNNKDILDKVYILNFGIKEDNIIKLLSIGEKYGCAIDIVQADNILKPLFDELNIQKFEGSYATYARAFIAEILKDYNGKILYIDSDTVVNGSLYGLKELNMEGKAYAAVIGMNQYVYPFCEFPLKSQNTIYYACGVILFNLQVWRDQHCTEKIVSFVRSNNGNFIYADQTVINNSIPNSLAMGISLKYNYWGHMYRGCRIYYELTRKNFYTIKQVHDAIIDPVIIHYKGLIVHPWLSGNVSSLSGVFYYYWQMSPWEARVEHSIYYDEVKGFETDEQRERMVNSRRYLKWPALIALIVEKLVLLKHLMIGRRRSRK